MWGEERDGERDVMEERRKEKGGARMWEEVGQCRERRWRGRNLVSRVFGKSPNIPAYKDR